MWMRRRHRPRPPRLHRPTTEVLGTLCQYRAYLPPEVLVSVSDFVEEVQVLGRDLVDKVKSLIHEGNVNRIIIKDDKGNTFVEIPVTVAAVGAVLSPVLAAIGAISAMVAKFKIVVERAQPKAQDEKSDRPE